MEAIGCCFLFYPLIESVLSSFMDFFILFVLFHLYFMPFWSYTGT